MVSEKALVYVSSYDEPYGPRTLMETGNSFLGDAGNAQEVSFDDSRWRSVNLPHDYSIEQEYSSNMERKAAICQEGRDGIARILPRRKARLISRSVWILTAFYMNAAVYINGKELGSHPYGYSPFSFDLTPYLNFGGDNVIAVKVNHQTPSSRWYSGSGIYRDVKLTITPMVHEL